MSLPPRILLADDDSEVRHGVAELLRIFELEVLHAGDGLEAVAIARSEPLDAALLDLNMPGRTGLDCLPHLFESRAGLPCLLYTGRWSAALENAALAAGARALLRKPVEPVLLRREVSLALGIDEPPPVA